MSEPLRDLAWRDLPSHARPPLLAVALCRTNPVQFHCGVLFEAEDAHRLLHLAFHHDLRNERWDGVGAQYNYWWFATDLSPEAQAAVAAACELIVERYLHKVPAHRIPYGVLYRGASFDPGSGELDLCGANGLTCATFVFAMFASCGIRLVDIDVWPHRDEDARWHASVVSLLRTRGADPEHVAAVETEPRCARYRPEEVAAVAWLGRAVDALAAIEAGARISGVVSLP